MLATREAAFLDGAGIVVGAAQHLPEEARLELTEDLLSAEALGTSEIEGEILDRASVQASLRQALGLAVEARRLPPAERGIAELLADVYQRAMAPLDETRLWGWHRTLLHGRANLVEVGTYRTNPDPMRIVSGDPYMPTVHFEAPPSSLVPAEMERFLAWFAATGPAGTQPLPGLTRAGLAHLWFVCIDRFEDGNGRIGRAIVELALAQALGQQNLNALSSVIRRRRREYYDVLARVNQGLDIDPWLDWFADIALAAQAEVRAWVTFTIEKTRLLERLRGRLNARQLKALLRVLREGPAGFRGGLSAGNNIRITGTTPATAGRDLRELVALGALYRTGERRGARYWLPFATRETA